MTKKLIISANGVGNSLEINTAVSELLCYGLIRNITLQPNGQVFNEAINLIARKKNISIGIHLNITSGKAICQDLISLCDENCNFNNNFYSILFKSLYKNDEKFLLDIEREFRKQIETMLSKTIISHIDSNDFIHSIPTIFDLTCKLAVEYRIPFITTHFEANYFIPDIYKYLNINILSDIIRKYMLNIFSTFNENTALKYGLKTNDFYIGTAYKSEMDLISVIYGVKSINYDNKIVELAFHPCRYQDGIVNNHFKEYLLLRNKKLKKELKNLGYELACYDK